MNSRPNNLSRRRAGFTLIESVMSVLIVSGVLVAALGTFGAIGRARHTQVERASANYLAERILTEAAQCYFQDPAAAVGSIGIGPETGENTRSAYDDVDDYHNLVLQPPVLRDGSAMGDYAGWKVAVTVEHARLDNPATASLTYTGLKRVRVVVTTPAGANIEASTVRAVDGAYEQLPTATTNYLTWTGVSARISEKGKMVYGGARPLNVTTSQ